MAIYHLEAKIISRGAGRSAVAAAAYMSCSRIYNEYDGVQHDYTHKRGLVWEHVFLPEDAPAEWQDRSVLWNAVEEAEKSKDSRLAREFIVALPVELNREQWQILLTEFIQSQFVADGMCADVAIHDTDGHNPHAHIMLTVRPLNKDGTWQHKTEKEYLCVRNGEERGFTSVEFKTVQAQGWEKQYQYQVGKKRVYMPPSAAKGQGYERVSKSPKSTRYGRQNPISARWNSEEQLVLWREAWADTVNLALERANREGRIDHRSYTERGLDEQPTVHEGISARTLEHQGFTMDRCELNRQIRKDNVLLHTLKAEVQKLVQAVQNTLPAIAEAMETLRGRMLIFCYQLSHIRTNKTRVDRNVHTLETAQREYTSLNKQIKEKNIERKDALAEKRVIPKIHIWKHRDLSRHIAELTEELEELWSEKTALLQRLDYGEDTDISNIREDISAAKDTLKKLEQQEQKYAAELGLTLVEYSGLKEQAADFDPVELYRARQTEPFPAERTEESGKTLNEI